MSKAEDDARAKQIAGDYIATTIQKFIDGLPAAQRMYPDLYAYDLAQAVRIATIKELHHK